MFIFFKKRKEFFTYFVASHNISRFVFSRTVEQRVFI